MGTKLSGLHPSSQSPAASPDEDIDVLSLVDVLLYVLLMQICTGRKQFPSAYDKAHLVLKFMEKAGPTSFAREISQEVDNAFEACKGELEDMGPLVEGVIFSPLLPSVPNELSSQLFHLMIPYMSKLGAVMSGGERTPRRSHRRELSYTNIMQPRLFKKGTNADGLVKNVIRFQYKEVSSSAYRASCYDNAYILRGICGVAGPTTNPISLMYYQLTAAMIEHFGRTMLGSLDAPYSLQPCEKPSARLVRTMSNMHSDLLMSSMKKIVQTTGYTPSPGGDTLEKTIQKWTDEMAIVNVLAWLGKHRRNFLDMILDAFPPEAKFKLFEDDEATDSV